jgi:hypothetical protein
MKILLIGNEDFLYSLLGNLTGSSFIQENNIHVMVAKFTPKISFRSIRNKLKKFDLDEVIIWIDRYIYRDSHNEILSLLFPPISIDKICDSSNITFLDFVDPEIIGNLPEYDYLIISSYPRKISEEVIRKPRLGTLNIHPSLLPKLRGGYPTYVETYYEYEQSSATLHLMSKMFDAGDIVAQGSEDIDRTSTNAARYYKSSTIAAQLLNDWFRVGCKVKTVPQDSKEASYCNKLLTAKRNVRKMTASDNIVQFTKANFIRHLFPFTYCLQTWLLPKY